MTIDRLKRVVWRLQEIEKREEYSNSQVRLAIMEECGTDERTIEDAIKKMIELKMLEPGAFGFLRLKNTHQNG